MISDVDDVLRKLILREVNIQDNEVDVVFDQPKREWSSRLSKPTLDLFLFDLRENLRLRGAEQNRANSRPDGYTEIHRNPIWLDLRYLMTAWVKEAEDEHFLLSSAILGLLRNPYLPKDLLTERLQDQPTAISLEVATFPPENGPVDKFSEIWGVLDNEMRPGVLVTITICMDPFKPAVYPQVTSRQARFVQNTPTPESSSQSIHPVRKSIKADSEVKKSASKTYYSVGGKIRSEKYAPALLSVVLVEKQLPIELDEEGKFAINSITAGEYHLDILYNQKVLKRQIIQVPAPSYEILV